MRLNYPFWVRKLKIKKTRKKRQYTTWSRGLALWYFRIWEVSKHYSQYQVGTPSDHHFVVLHSSRQTNQPTNQQNRKTDYVNYLPLPSSIPLRSVVKRLEPSHRSKKKEKTRVSFPFLKILSTLIMQYLNLRWQLEEMRKNEIFIANEKVMKRGFTSGHKKHPFDKSSRIRWRRRRRSQDGGVRERGRKRSRRRRK